jgi:SP family sugar:H+ symporter-like MFS transporter
MIYAFLGHYCITHQSAFISAQTAGALMLVFSCFAIVGFATTWGPLPWVVCAEIFAPRWKAVGMGLATGTNWIFSFLIGFFTFAITQRIGYGLGWLFSGAILAGGVFVLLAVPETAGKSLEEIDKEILDGVKAWETRKRRVE